MSTIRLVAHTPNDSGEWHSLKDHLLGVAEMAREFGEPLGLGEAAYWTGLWHDVGKASCTFQDYLSACAAGDPSARIRFPVEDRDHKRAGVSLACESGCISAAFAIDGHHGGLPSGSCLKGRILSGGEFEDVISAVATTVDKLKPDTALKLPRLDPRDEEMRIRFLASCLVDADFLDTERHFSPNRDADRSVPTLASLQSTFDQAIVSLRKSASDTAINRMRSDYFDHVVKRSSSCRTGMYRMTGRTGIGKTLAGLGAGMAHAAANGKRRVVMALPYTTVTEQTADVYRSVLGHSAAVLEHHSGISEEADTLWRRLAAENWDAPVVVTTVVQLFESLFSRKPSKLRKLHRLASSVLILDEAQTVPGGVLEPIVEALTWLVRYADCSIILMTATQPAFDLVGSLKDMLLSDWGDFAVGSTFDRVRWRFDPEPLSPEALADQISEQAASLCITNTVKDAVRVSGALEIRDPTYLHLSTRLCREHRRAALKEITKRLREGSSCRVVSTQLVEAGVDLDFPSVIRVLGPLPSLAQAAGRCNRHGGQSYGDMRVVDLLDGGLPPGEYKIGTQQTSVVRTDLGDEFYPEDSKALRKWFELLYRSIDMDDRDVNSVRDGFDFPAVAKRFRLIDESLTMVVPWGSDDELARVENITECLAGGQLLTRSDWRFLTGYTVNLLPGLFARAVKMGLVQVIEEGVLGRWVGPYDQKLGVVIEPLDEKEGLQW